jgi:uncharacterized SAM-dependent methyltransferase
MNIESPIQMLVHPSRFPECIQADLSRCLRERRVSPKFHYESPEQTLRWLAVHEQCSPARKDPACEGMYRASFDQVAHFWDASVRTVHVIGVGCGGGQKDAALIGSLVGAGRQVVYTPVDISPGMVITSARTAAALFPSQAGGAQGRCAVTAGVVCDFELVSDPASLLQSLTPPEATRLVTFFGVLPNLEPATAWSRLAGWLRPGDGVLLSANLVPGEDYATGMARILPQYDNAPTAEWLTSLMSGFGCAPADGIIRCGIEPVAEQAGPELMRVTADYEFLKARKLNVWQESFSFEPGERIRLFYSCRYTSERTRAWAGAHGFRAVGEFIVPSGEEGIWLCLA